MDKKDRDLIMKIGKRLSDIEKQQKEYQVVNSKLIKIIEQQVVKNSQPTITGADITVQKRNSQLPDINIMELDFFLELSPEEVQNISVTLRKSMLEIMRNTGIKRISCNITQE